MKSARGYFAGIVFSLFFGAILLLGCAPVSEPNWDQTLAPRAELSAVALAKEGNALAAQGRGFDAELKFRQALALYPDAVSVQEGLAAALVLSGQIEEAQTILQPIEKRYLDQDRALRAIAPSDNSRSAVLTRVQMAKVRILIAEQRHGLASESLYRYLNMALDRNDNAAATTFMKALAQLRFRAGDEAQGVCDLRWVFARTGAQEDRLALMRAYLSVARAEEVMEMIETSLAEGVAVSGVDSDVQLLRALALISLGRFKEALFVAESILVAANQTSPETLSDAQLVRYQLLALKLAGDPTELDDLDDEEVDMIHSRLNDDKLRWWPPAILVRSWE
jgi:tetratricopeptide (TPR) repeat protein